MDILVGDLVSEIKKVFNKSKVLSVDTTSESINGSDDLKLIISINRILFDEINVIYTKILFVMDSTKTNIIKNNFTYLYDINCEYIRIQFSDLIDFENKIKEIFKNEKFGDDIKILSKFIKSPATLINTWFKNNKISDLSITNIELKKIPIIRCELISFDFVIGLNNNQTGDLKLTKKDSKYKYEFKFLDEIYEDEKIDLTSLVETIGNNLKNKVKM